MLFDIVVEAIAVVVSIFRVWGAVTIGIQLELRRSVILRAIRIGHLNRNINFLSRISIQLLAIDLHGDYTSVLVDRGLIPLRSLKTLRDRKLRPPRSLSVLLLPVLEDRGGRRIRTRNNQLIFV